VKKGVKRGSYGRGGAVELKNVLLRKKVPDLGEKKKKGRGEKKKKETRGGKREKVKNVGRKVQKKKVESEGPNEGYLSALVNPRQKEDPP